jgi:hypothetical protein
MAKGKKKKRKDKPKGFRKLRHDSAIGAACKGIEEAYGLPEGSVRLVRPSGRRAESDWTIDRLRELWEAQRLSVDAPQSEQPTASER